MESSTVLCRVARHVLRRPDRSPRVAGQPGEEGSRSFTNCSRYSPMRLCLAMCSLEKQALHTPAAPASSLHQAHTRGPIRATQGMLTPLQSAVTAAPNKTQAAGVAAPESSFLREAGTSALLEKGIL